MSTSSPNSATGGPHRESIWARPERRGRGPTPTYSRATIVSAAVDLADAHGIAAVSMRAVALALGTSAGALYRYLSSREDLLDLMTDAVLGELRPYPGRDQHWLDAMLAVARGQLALHRAHPWLVETMQRPTALGPEGLAWFDGCLQILQPVPSSVTAKFEAIAMVTGVVTLVARSEATTSTSPFARVDLTAYPHLAAALGQPPGPPPQRDLFERTLRALLTGLLVEAEQQP